VGCFILISKSFHFIENSNAMERALIQIDHLLGGGGGGGGGGGYFFNIKVVKKAI